MTAETKARAACLIGWPAAHSRSPLIHHYWLRTLRIEGGYNIEAVPPEGFAEFVLHLSTHGFVGANVTIPHKERALALTKPDERARAVGAAITLWYEGAELYSTNTDIEGFIGNLDACAQASRLPIKPSMSVLVEYSSAPSYHSVMAAPTARARSSGLVSASARSLCGMVTLAPTKPWVDKCSTNSAKPSGGTASIL